MDRACSARPAAPLLLRGSGSCSCASCPVFQRWRHVSRCGTIRMRGGDAGGGVWGGVGVPVVPSGAAAWNLSHPSSWMTFTQSTLYSHFHTNSCCSVEASSLFKKGLVVGEWVHQWRCGRWVMSFTIMFRTSSVKFVKRKKKISQHSPLLDGFRYHTNRWPIKARLWHFPYHLDEPLTCLLSANIP